MQELDELKGADVSTTGRWTRAGLLRATGGDVNRFSAQVNFFGGVRVIDTVHVVIFAFLIFYVLVYVYLGSLGHTRTAYYKAMLTDYEDVEEVPAGEWAPEPVRDPLGTAVTNRARLPPAFLGISTLCFN